MQIIRKFVRSTGGNVAIMFGLAAVPLIGAGGMALDYMAASKSQSALQKAVDDAALAAGASIVEGDANLTKLVKKYLHKNGAQDVLDKITKIKVKTIADKKIKVIVKGRVNTSFMGLVGQSKLRIKALAVVNRDFGNLELALVLDNTGSMNADGKLNSLKDSAKILVRELFEKKGSGSEMKIGIVPFSQYVNVGVDKRGSTWLDVPDDTSEEITATRNVTEIVPGSERNCGMRTSTYTNDGVTTTSSYYGCDYDYNVTGTEEYTYTNSTTWSGCVGSRDYPLNVKDIRPRVKITGLMNTGCARPITALTEQRSKIDNEIDALTATGETYLPAGLIWGWRMLSKAAPLKDGVSYHKMERKGYTKAIVLMTDGINTQTPVYPTHTNDGGDATTANALTAELCTNIKNSGANDDQHIKIYTVTFAVTDPTVKSLLRNCATNSSFYFDASDKVALTEAFQDIARSLITLRLAK